MPKAYWIAHVDIHDAELFRSYQQANGAPIAAFGGRFIVRGGQSEMRAGSMRARHVVVEFPSLEAARACYDSAAYQATIPTRDSASHIDIVIVEGVADAPA